SCKHQKRRRFDCRGSRAGCLYNLNRRLHASAYPLCGEHSTLIAIAEEHASLIVFAMMCDLPTYLRRSGGIGWTLQGAIHFAPTISLIASCRRLPALASAAWLRTWSGHDDVLQLHHYPAY